METQTQAPERVLIAERKDRQRQTKEATQRIEEAAAQLATLFADLDIGEFNDAALLDVYKTGGEQTRRLYLDHARAEASKIESPVLRRSILEGIEANTPRYFAKAKEVQSTAGYNDRYLLGYMTATAEGAILTDENAARLADSCREYITDPEEIAKYRQHEAAVNALNVLFENGVTMPLVWYSIFSVNHNGKISIPESGVNYAYLLRKRRESPENTQPETTFEEPWETPQLKQQNRQRGGIVKGITKPPVQHDRGAELRRGVHKPSPGEY